MRREWFNAAEISAERLPEMPASQRRVARLAQMRRWDDGTLARARQARGGGLEYHYTLLPAAAQAALVARYSAANDDATGEKALKRTNAAQAAPKGEGAWAWYEAQPDSLKQRAQARMAAVTQVEALARRLGRGCAVRQVAAEAKVSKATIHNWMELVRGIPRADWLPALVPVPRGGGGRAVEIDEAFWDAFRVDYLRLSRPSLTSCLDRQTRAAALHGWRVPNEKTLRRRVEAIPKAVRVLAREGRDAVKRLYPAQERDRSKFHALECVNADGHKWDVFVKWEDGTISRPLMVAFQDLYSGMFVAWRMARSENKDAVRLCFGDLIETYGIPDHCWLDNGRAFASKWLTGGMATRFRFKIKAEEPDGIFTQLGVQVHWTTPYAGQSKPIERGFGDFARDIAKHPAFEGAYCGNGPLAKPENYGTAAVPIELFTQILNQEIAAHNARTGRDTRVCGGKLSFAQAFAESYAQAPIRKATEEQRRMCMLAAEKVTVRRDGALHFAENRYWHAALHEHIGRLVTVRFDPDNLHTDMGVYAMDGTLICVAQLIEAAGFNDTAAARAHAANRNAYIRATREALDAERRMTLRELVALQPKTEAPAMPQSKVVRPLFAGNAALKPVPQTEAEEDDFDTVFARGLRLVREANQEF